MKLALISLGCEKNMVDSELFLGLARRYDLEIVSEMSDANIIVVNTCGFIEPAKKQSIDYILEACDMRKNGAKVIIMGCLVERYLDDLQQEIPEVDYYLPIRSYEELYKVFNEITGKNYSYKMDFHHRFPSKLPNTSAYLRIADGCDNRCSYCAIPLIRKSFRSRPFDEVVEEAKLLAENGAKEITLIAQDTTRYGTDFKDDKRRLPDLLREISKIKEVVWLRVLYLYPDEITDELLEEFKNNDKVVKYFDIPIQHASNKILKAMNRRGSKELILEHINKFRSVVPNLVIRSTFMTGFPGESVVDFNELVELVKEVKFDRLGGFTYSDEEDTAAYLMQPKVPEKVKTKRYEKIMEIQNEISLKKNKELIGARFKCIIDDYDEANLAYIGRNYMYAPDDVDGRIYIYSPLELPLGIFIECEIVDADAYDLYAKVV